MVYTCCMEKKNLLIKKSPKKLTLEDQIDSLARIVVSGFEQVNKRFEQIHKRFEQVDTQLNSMSHELKDHSFRLDRIEKRQMGTLATLDETVHRGEFKTLTKRVEVLERKK